MNSPLLSQLYVGYLVVCAQESKVARCVARQRIFCVQLATESGVLSPSAFGGPLRNFIALVLLNQRDL